MEKTQLVKISAMASVLPECVVSTEQLEERIRHAGGRYANHIDGSITTLTGVKTRRYAPEGVESSDLAATAARRVLDATGTSTADVDLLLFACASADMVEPATAHITQYKLGTNAAVMDVKNACNSFLNGLEVAEALIRTGQYRRALVVTGEIPSRSIRWKIENFRDLKNSFMGYTFGDAGAAALLEPSDDETGIFYRKFFSVSKHWELCTLPGGGTAHPRGDEYTYARSDGPGLRNAFVELGPREIFQALAKTGLTLKDFSRVLVHQVSLPSFHDLMSVVGLPEDKVVVTIADYGNMASASLPTAFCQAVARGEIKRGDNVLVIGLAAGISLGIMMFRY